jgi:curved DNA-binding protein CbpA
MVSTVSSRPNHYEVLGLGPDASSDEITAAFAREVTLFRPRPLGGLAQVSIAYETLRDPARRRAYDASLGLRREPAPSPAGPRDRVPGPSPASANLIERLARDSLPPEPKEKIASFMAASPRPEPPRQPEPVERIRLEPQFSSDRAPLRRARADRAPMKWNRQGLAAGALIGSAALLGAWVGLEAGNDNQSERPERTVTTKLPPATALPIATASLSASAPAMAEARPERQARATVRRIERARPPLQIHQPEVQRPDAAQLAQSLVAAPEQAVAESQSVEATAAKLPLPNSVIARTIGRIGYACGQVASTTAVEGATGVFKVTCTSGHSYRAAPVRGRYRFKRL